VWGHAWKITSPAKRLCIPFGAKFTLPSQFLIVMFKCMGPELEPSRSSDRVLISILLFLSHAEKLK
jgi:hypothetical protein